MKDLPVIDPRASDSTSNNASFVVVRELIGAAVLLLIIRAAEPLFFGAGFYAKLSAHPYWMVVILASAQSGLLKGVMTAVFATALMDWPPRPIDVDITAHYVSQAIVPVQWLLAAIVIGSYRQQQIRYETGLEREVARLVTMTEDFAHEIKLLDQEIQTLELKSATQVDDSPTQKHALIPKSCDRLPLKLLARASAVKMAGGENA